MLGVVRVAPWEKHSIKLEKTGTAHNVNRT